MSVSISNNTGVNIAGVDTAGNLTITDFTPPTVLGAYSVAGGPAGIVAASLAADTSLAFIFNAGARKARLRKFQMSWEIATVGTSALVPGAFGLQRISVAAPSGGTARTPAAADPTNMAATSMTAQDLASALTVTGVTIGDRIASIRQGLGIATGSHFIWNYEPKFPQILLPTQGIVLRTRVAGPATQTYVFDWTAEWDEVAV